jgi:hypothetical protein
LALALVGDVLPTNIFLELVAAPVAIVERAWLMRKRPSVPCAHAPKCRPATGTLEDFVVQVDDGRLVAAESGGGVTVALASGDTQRELAAHGGKPVRIAASQSLDVLWEYLSIAPAGDDLANGLARLG